MLRFYNILSSILSVVDYSTHCILCHSGPLNITGPVHRPWPSWSWLYIVHHWTQNKSEILTITQHRKLTRERKSPYQGRACSAISLQDADHKQHQRTCFTVTGRYSTSSYSLDILWLSYTFPCRFRIRFPAATAAMDRGRNKLKWTYC